MARTRGSDPRVRRLARMMANDYARLQRRGGQLMEDDSVSLRRSTEGDELRASSRSAVERLGPLRGAAFDRAFLSAQIDQQEAVLRVIDGKLMQGAQREAVRALVRSLRPNALEASRVAARQSAIVRAEESGIMALMNSLTRASLLLSLAAGCHDGGTPGPLPPGQVLVENFCPSSLSAKYMRCYVLKSQDTGY